MTENEATNKYFWDFGKISKAIKKYAVNEDVIIAEIHDETFVRFLRTNKTQKEETFEGAMHKFYY